MKTENLWGIFFPQQKNFFNFKLMINQQKNDHPIDKIKSQKTTKKTHTRIIQQNSIFLNTSLFI